MVIDDMKKSIGDPTMGLAQLQGNFFKEILAGEKGRIVAEKVTLLRHELPHEEWQAEW
jgi:hypothetical protein